MPNMDMVDPVICSGERQCFEEYFARSVQCIMGLTNVNKQLSKHPTWLLPKSCNTKMLAVLSFFNGFACTLQK